MEEEWVFLVEAFNDIEAEIICGMLKAAGIPARKEDSDAYAGALRVIAGQAMEVQVKVPGRLLERARALLRSLDTDG
jgi:hypothetical protein